MSIRNTISASLADFEEAAGYCKIAAHGFAANGEVEKAAFLAGANLALRHFPYATKPESLKYSLCSWMGEELSEYGIKVGGTIAETLGAVEEMLEDGE